MKSSRVFIKANYIKKAKEDWVYCDATVITHDKLSVLKLTSINNENKVNEVKTVKGSVPVNSLKVLLNLSEFKSSEIKPVNFRNVEKFAIKLVPSGILHKKRLLLVPEDEDDLTKWYGVLGDHVHKLKEGEICKSDVGTMKSKTKKIDVVESKIESHIANHQEEKIEEVYFSMDDNDVYDGNSLENSYTVCVEESADSKKLGIKGSFLLRLREEGLELVDIKSGAISQKFPYVFIRRFGAKDDVLRLEAGRKCTTGEGFFMFRFKNAQKAVDTIRQLVKELKNAASNTPTNFERRDSFTMSVMSGNNEDSTETSPKRNHWSNSSNSVSSSSPIVVKPVEYTDGSAKQTFFSQEGPARLRSPPPIISPKPQINHPLYASINSGHSERASPSRVNVPTTARHLTVNRPPMVNNNFTRSNQAAASFSHSRPSHVNIPVTRISQDDSHCLKMTGSELYDNVPVYGRQNVGNSNLPYNANSSVRYSSSYSMQGPIAGRNGPHSAEVPNNQRCIQELETMLQDLGIPSR